MSRAFLTPIGVIVQGDDGALIGEDGEELDDEQWDWVDTWIQAGQVIETQNRVAEREGVFIDWKTRDYMDMLAAENDLSQREAYERYIAKPDMQDRATRLSQLAGMVDEARGRADAADDIEEYLDPDREGSLGDPRSQEERRQDLAHEIRMEMEDVDEWGADNEALWRDREGS